MKVPSVAVLCLSPVLLITACSSDQLYFASREWQKDQCRAMRDADQQRRCLKDASTPHDVYERQSRELKPNKGPRALTEE